MHCIHPNIRPTLARSLKEGWHFPVDVLYTPEHKDVPSCPLVYFRGICTIKFKEIKKIIKLQTGAYKIKNNVHKWAVGPVAQSVYRLAMGWTVRGSNPGVGEIFRTCPGRPWSPLSLLYNGYRVFCGGKEQPGRDADPSPPSSGVGHERVELYLYSPCGLYGLYRA